MISQNRELPILFSAPMVRAILSGDKTQTRRIVKPRRCPDFGCELSAGEMACESPESIARLCPYGAPGSLLWVRETWAAPHQFDHLPPRLIEGTARIHYAADEPLGGLRWRPSIHMPRAFSRIRLRIKTVHIEKLRSINDADAMNEGISALVKLTPDGGKVSQYLIPDGSFLYFEDGIVSPTKYGITDRHGFPGVDDCGWPWSEWRDTPTSAYFHLWEEINGIGSVAKNPWVWVLTFERDVAEQKE